MSQLFPAILIGGPPHRGKSVLSYILSETLKRRQVPIYLLRATPDGEGNWYQEAPVPVAQRLRVKHPWNPLLEERIETVLMNRPLPFLVDAGGRPTPSQQERLFSRCTHSIFLGKDEGELAVWRAIGAQYQVQPLVEIQSVLEAKDEVLSDGSPLRLQLGHLERQRDRASGTSEAWQRLIDRVQQALVWQPDALWAHHRGQLPPEVLPLNLDQWLDQRSPGRTRWSVDDLPDLVREIPTDTPIALYAGRPVWLPAAVAAAMRAEWYCFDARYGWLPIPQLVAAADESAWRVRCLERDRYRSLSFQLRAAHLHPKQTLYGPLPVREPDRPIALDGKLPGWLYAALVQHYARAGHQLALAIPSESRAVYLNGPDLGTSFAWQSIDDDDPMR